MRQQFKEILNDFIPRYIGILQLPKYKNNVEEILIEGHTSNPGNKYNYMDGILLSQSRTNNVLYHIVHIESFADSPIILEWIKGRITANGLSSSRPILNLQNEPDWKLSRRVEFRVRTNAEEQIREILDIGARYGE